MQAGQCGNQIGGDGEYCGGNDAQIDRINVLHHEASGGKYVPRAVFFEPGMIDAVRASPLVELFRPGNLVNQSAGAGSNLAKGHFRRAEHQFF
jgi:tubulin beta